MGFFGTRPGLKRAVRDAARPFFVAEAFATVLGDAGTAMVSGAEPQLALLTRTDHHDFVTGTSSDAVVDDEQMPLLTQAETTGSSTEALVAQTILPRIPVTPGAVARLLAFNASSVAVSDVAEVGITLDDALTLPVRAVSAGQPLPLEVVGAPTGDAATLRVGLSVPPWSFTAIDLLPGAVAPAPAVSLQLLDASGAPATASDAVRVVLSNAHVRAELDAGATGFALSSLVIDGVEAIAAPSMTVNDYADDGGLWRLGNEMGPACTLTPMSPPSLPSTVQVLELASLEVRVAFVAPTYTLEASLGAGTSALDVAITTAAAETTTRTVSLDLAVAPGAGMTTSSPAGLQARPAQYVFDPTFFPAVAWTKVDDWAVLLRQSTGVRMSTPGQLELMAARDARNEQCDVMGGTGTDTDAHRIEWRIVRAVSAADAERAAQAYDRPLDLELLASAQQASPTDLPAQASLASIDGEGVISAIKPADRGDGVIVRVLLQPGPAELHLTSSLAGRQVNAVDLAERDLSTPVVSGDTIPLDPGGLRPHRQPAASLVDELLEHSLVLVGGRGEAVGVHEGARGGVETRGHPVHEGALEGGPHARGHLVAHGEDVRRDWTRLEDDVELAGQEPLVAGERRPREAHPALLGMRARRAHVDVAAQDGAGHRRVAPHELLVGERFGQLDPRARHGRAQHRVSARALAVDPRDPGPAEIGELADAGARARDEHGACTSCRRSARRPRPARRRSPRTALAATRGGSHAKSTRPCSSPARTTR